jgi:hypothetical protein
LYFAANTPAGGGATHIGLTINGLPVSPPVGHLSVFIYLIIRYFKKDVRKIIITSIIILYVSLYEFIYTFSFAVLRIL